MALNLDLRDIDEMLKAGVLQPHAAIGAPTAPSIQQAQGAPGLPVSTPAPPDLQRPTKQESQAAGKREYELGKPTITAEPGLPGFYQQKEEQNQFAKEHPWGSPVSAHPGFLGKVGHALATAGNIAGDIFVPHVMENIPGTQLNREKKSAENAADFDRAQEVETQKEATEQRPELAELQGELRGAQQERTFNQQDKMQQEREAQADKARQEGEANLENRLEKTQAESDKRQQAQFAQQDQLEAKRELAAENRQNKQIQAQEDRFEKTQQAKDEQLTSTTRTMIEAAPRVLDFVQRIRPLIQQEQKDLGPASGRWSEFMAGKVGAPNPNFTKLRTDVGLLQTLLMRMHVGSRGGEYIMKHFQDLIDTGKQSPENLNAALDEIERYANDVAHEGQQGQQPAGAPPPGAKVRVWNPKTGKLE